MRHHRQRAVAGNAGGGGVETLTAALFPLTADTIDITGQEELIDLGNTPSYNSLGVKSSVSSILANCFALDNQGKRLFGHSGDWTLEFWERRIAYNGVPVYTVNMASGVASLAIGYNTNHAISYLKNVNGQTFDAWAFSVRTLSQHWCYEGDATANVIRRYRNGAIINTLSGSSEGHADFDDYFHLGTAAGYMADLRISRVARYKGAFTPTPLGNLIVD